MPLDRLSRARRQKSLTDRAIDLGIALEALLLHDDEKQGEIGYRLSLRGALLGGIGVQARKRTRKLLKDIHNLRSTAVHKGRVESSRKNAETLQRGQSACADLIRLVIAKQGTVDFRSLELGE